MVAAVSVEIRISFVLPDKFATNKLNETLFLVTKVRPAFSR